MTSWPFWVAAVAIPLLLTELGGWAPWLARRVVCRAAGRLGEPFTAARYTEEFLAVLNRVPGRLTQLITALGIYICIPFLRRAAFGPVGESGLTATIEPIPATDNVLRMPPSNGDYSVYVEVTVIRNDPGRSR